MRAGFAEDACALKVHSVAPKAEQHKPFVGMVLVNLDKLSTVVTLPKDVQKFVVFRKGRVHAQVVVFNTLKKRNYGI